MALGTPYTVCQGNEVVSVNTTSFAVAVTQGTAAGDTIAVACLNNDTQISGVTDSQGNTYSLVASETTLTAMHISLYVSASQFALTTSDTITMSFAGTATFTTTLSLIARACPGCAASPADPNSEGSASNTSTAVSVTSAGTTQTASEWAVFIIGNANGSGSPAALGGTGTWTQQAQQHPAGNPYLTWYDQILTSPQSLSGTATLVSGKWGALLGGFQAAGAPSGPVPALPGPVWKLRYGEPSDRAQQISFQPPAVVSLWDADTGSGADTEAPPSAALSSADTGSGAESSITSPQGSDSAAGTEAVSSLPASLSNTDTGAGADTGTVFQPAQPSRPAQPGQSWRLKFGQPQDRSGLAIVFNSPVWQPQDSDFGQGSDDGAITPLGTGTANSDSASGAEAAASVSLISDTDASSAAEVVLSPGPPVSGVSARPGPAWLLKFGQPQERSDVRPMLLPQTWSRALSGTDTGAGYDAAPPARLRRVGAMLGSGTAGDQTIAQFEATVGGPYLGMVYFFYQANIPASLGAAPQNLSSYAGKCRARVDFELAHYGSTNADGTANVYVPGSASNNVPAGAVTAAGQLAAFIASCQTGGLDLTVVLWHEAYSKFNAATVPSGTNPATGGAWTQVEASNLDYTNSIGYFGAVLRSYGLPVVFDPTNYSTNLSYGHWPETIGSAAAPGLGWAACAKGYIDEIATDIYVNEFATGVQGTLDSVAALADAFGLPLGLYELGFAPALVASPFSQADVDALTGYVVPYMQARAAAGKLIGDITVWATNDTGGTGAPNGIYLATSWSATTISRYATLFSQFDSQLYGGPGGQIQIISSDAGTAAEAGSVLVTSVTLSSADSAAAAEGGHRFPPGDYDSAAAADAAALLAAAVRDGDTALAADTELVSLPLSSSDAASSAEAQGTGTPVPVTQAGSPGISRSATGSVTASWGAGQPGTRGDVLVAVVFCQATGSVTAGPPLSVAGFTRVAHVTSDPVTPRVWLDIYTRTAAGSDALPSFSFAASGTVSSQCLLFELANASPALDGTGYWASGSAPATIVSETVTATAAVKYTGEFAIAAFGRAAQLSATSWTPGAGWTGAASDAGLQATAHLSADIWPGPASGALLTETGSWSDAGTGAYGAAVLAIVPSGAVAIADSDNAAAAESSPRIAPQPILNANWDFETGVAPWVAFGGGGSESISQSSAWFYGTPVYQPVYTPTWPGNSLLLVPDGIHAVPGAWSEAAIPVTPGTRVTFSTWAYSPQGWATGVQLVIWWGTSGASVASTPVPLAAGVQALLSLAAVVPLGVTTAQLTIQAAGTPPGSAQFFFDYAALSGPAGEYGGGAEASTFSAPAAPQDADAASAADVSVSLAAAVSGSDAAAGAETWSPIALGSQAEAAAGSDASSLSAAVPGSDIAAGSDGTASLAAAQPGTDAAAGAEAGAPAAVLGAADTGSGAETGAALAAQVPGTDTAVAAEGAPVTILVLPAAGEAGTGAEAAAASAVLSDADAGAGADTASATTVARSDSDTGHGTELATASGTLVADADTAAAHESDFSFPAGSDSVTGSESAIIGRGASDSATAAEAEFSRWPADADAAAGADTGYWTGPLSDADAVAGSEAVLQVALAAAELAAGAEGDDTTGLAGSLDVWATAPPTHSTAGYYRVTWRMPDGSSREIWRTPSFGEFLARDREARAHRLRGGPVSFVSDSDSATGSDQYWHTASVQVSVDCPVVLVAVQPSALVAADVPVSGYAADGPLFRDPAFGLTGG